MADMIRAEGLVKRFGELTALGGLDLAVPEGTVLGLLGPNGAGKTTAVRILTTLLPMDGGRAEVAGIDVASDPQGVRRRIGLSGQYAAVDEQLTGFENLEMVGRLYGMRAKQAKARARELLERFGLADAGNRPSKTYSGGMRRRLDLAGALVAEPTVLVLDEPTTGLDVRSRLQMWDVIRDLVGGGTTLLLTTQYLEEADQLAHDIIVIDHGKAIARGTADELKGQTGGERIAVVVAPGSDVEAVRSALARVAEDEIAVDDDGRRFTAAVTDGPRSLRALLADLEGVDATILDVGLRRPTMDEVFLTLTGRPAEEATGDAASATTEGSR